MRWIWCPLVVVGLLVPVTVPQARAGGKGDEPTVVIRVNSLDTALKDLKVLTRLINRDKFAQDIQELLQNKAGAKGLHGIDLSRPAGAYVRFGEEVTDINGAVLIPIADTEAFLTLLGNLRMNPTKGKDGLYTVTLNQQSGQNIDIYMRIVNKYACFSAPNPDNLAAGKLLDPSKVLAGPADSLLSIVARLDQVPAFLRGLAVSQIEEQLRIAQDKAPAQPETPAQAELRKAMIKQASRVIGDTFNDGQRAQLDVSMAKDTKDLTLRLSLSAKPGSELAKTIKNAGEHKSPFAGLLTTNAAFRTSVDVSFPPEVHKAFAKVIEDAAQKSLGELSDPAKRAQAQALVDAIIPTVKSGKLDAFFGMAGPTDNHYTLLGAIKLTDGDRVGKIVHDLLANEIKSMPAAQRDKVKLDFASVGDVKIHKLELPPDPKTKKVLEGLPGDANLYVAFRKDAGLLAIGPQALPALKEAIGSQQSGTAPMFQFDFSVGRMANTIAKTAEQKQEAAKLFPAGKDGRVRMVVNGGEAMTLRLDIALNVLEFVANIKDKK
jgi:hypothetical protein